MVYIQKGIKENMGKAKVNHSVDEETVVIGRGGAKVSQSETKRMLEESILTGSKEERAVYEKVYKGIKRT